MVTLADPSGEVITVVYATADAGAEKDSDYTAISGTLIFEPGDTSEEVGIEVSGSRDRRPTATR